MRAGPAQPLRKLVIVGVGLIGGSFALDLRRAGLVQHVVGVGRSAENLQRALQLGVIDEASQSAAEAVRDADLVLLATPVGQMAALLREIGPVLAPHTLLTDAGSTKRDVVALYRQYLPQQLAQCIPAHPIAGAEQSGAAAARYGLYQRRKVVLAPLPETAAAATQQVAALWQACGAQLEVMSADEHDAVFAAVSHLPHLLAFAYVAMVAGKPDAARCFDFAATGFRDFTRIAGSHPEMWRDIALANREPLLADLQAFRRQLDELTAQLQAGDGAALAALFATASEARNTWFQRFNAP